MIRNKINGCFSHFSVHLSDFSVNMIKTGNQQRKKIRHETFEDLATRKRLNIKKYRIGSDPFWISHQSEKFDKIRSCSDLFDLVQSFLGTNRD